MEEPTHRPVVAGDIIIGRLVIMAVLTTEWTFGAILNLVVLNVPSLLMVPASIDAIDLDKLTSIELFLWQWICVEVLIKLSQFSRPLTPVFLVATANFQTVERLFQTFIGKTRKFLVTSWARFLNCFDVLNTSFAKLLSTACDLVRLSNDLETNWTL